VTMNGDPGLSGHPRCLGERHLGHVANCNLL
jgi:hypothetical protein